MQLGTPNTQKAFVALMLSLLGLQTSIAEVNLARNHAALSSGPNWGSFKPSALTDGDPGTFTHPLASSGTRGFYYQVDLGRSYRLDRIILRNRADGCCPERLTRYRVEIYDDGDESVGALNWYAAIRSDGSNSGVGGIDTVTGNLAQDGRF